eukprot:TRINITY_DN7288_c0_g1_i1.p1 TRINITY_DN7288_c0_g1~~TRINITY_DN7288_c0_g1_i1.p1  ORF type:complete len:360 (+),score=83.14 TRINITY_DN7288_c0_g1_i1:148-1227(+)
MSLVGLNKTVNSSMVRQVGYRRVAPLYSRRVTSTGSFVLATQRKKPLSYRLCSVRQQSEETSTSKIQQEQQEEEEEQKIPQEIEVEAEEAKTVNGTTSSQPELEEQEQIPEEEQIPESEEETGEFKVPKGPKYLQLIASLSLRIKEEEQEEGEEELKKLEEEIQNLIKKSEDQENKREKSDTIASAAKEQFLRLQADFDNFRKRSSAEKSDAQSKERASLVEQLLPLVDNFELAANQIKINTEHEQKINDSYQGLYRQMVDIFRGIGISAVETVGSKFDPEVHEAIMREPNEEVPDGTVLEEFRKGFTIDGKLIRPAMVKVSFRDESEVSSSSDGSDWESEPENSADEKQQPENPEQQT